MYPFTYGERYKYKFLFEKRIYLNKAVNLSSIGLDKKEQNREL